MVAIDIVVTNRGDTVIVSRALHPIGVHPDTIDMTDDSTTPTDTMSPDECCGGATEWIERRDADALAARLGAVADPIRLQVLSIIANAPNGEVCACDFVGPLGKSQPTISHHLKVLSEAGLVTGDRRGRWIWYRLDDSTVSDLASTLGSITRPTSPTV